MANLWGAVNDTIPEQTKIDELIEEAIEQLKEGTHGKVQASYTKIDYEVVDPKNKKKDVADDILKKIFVSQSLFKNANADKIYFQEVNDYDDREDINYSYGTDVYKFEIFNNRYKFRILTMTHSIAFPVRIVPDEGIVQELEMGRPYRDVFSNEQLENFLEKVLSSRKVRNVISQLKILFEVGEGERIIEYLNQKGEATVSEIAMGINWSQNMTRDKLLFLEDNGKVESVGKGKHAQKWRLIGRLNQ